MGLEERSPRVRRVNEARVERQRAWVLYWMIAARRPRDSHALDRAVAWAKALDRPLLVLEPLRAGYRYASDRLHAFVLDGMRANAEAFGARGVAYYPYVEPSPGAGRGLLARLARDACLVVTDDYPSFFVPHMVEAAGQRLDVLLEAVDSNGLVPVRATNRAFTAAAHFRSYVHKAIGDALDHLPSADPLASHPAPAREPAEVPADVLARWPRASDALLAADPRALAALPIDHAVPIAPIRGGITHAEARLHTFVTSKLGAYSEARDEPDLDGTSVLSPYLHFGHVAASRVLSAVLEREGWTRVRVNPKKAGSREGFWGASLSAEAFLDQLVVWRELAFNTAATRPDAYDRFRGLPDWAQATLAEHASDPRPYLYEPAALEEGRTHDSLWNAAQNQLRQDGWMHNYLRMLWGKKILEWSPSPELAFDRMHQIMDRWALDGRDPCSYAGYTWVLGRYDRPWPERPVFGKVRTMTSASTARKHAVTKYISRYAGVGG